MNRYTVKMPWRQGRVGDGTTLDLHSPSLRLAMIVADINMTKGTAEIWDGPKRIARVAGYENGQVRCEATRCKAQHHDGDCTEEIEQSFSPTTHASIRCEDCQLADLARVLLDDWGTTIKTFRTCFEIAWSI